MESDNAPEPSTPTTVDKVDRNVTTSGPLAFTGGEIGGVLGLAAALVMVGVAARSAARRRRRRP